MIKLLLVEDDSTFSYIVKNELQEIIGGYEVITATNGAEGLKAWKEYHPDIIISDIDMPVMNGYQMVERIGWGYSYLVHLCIDISQRRERRI